MGFHVFTKTAPTRIFLLGAFGCVFLNNFDDKFHEGIGFISNQKGKKRESCRHAYFPAMAGTAYINHKSSESSYGKYLVLEHPDHSPSLYSLYAHLNTFLDDLRVGEQSSGC